MNDFLIIGAGLAGLACARELHAAGHSVRLLDKGRGVGGRCATRRASDHALFDHGAQFFTARSERLQKLTEGWLKEGLAREWYRTIPLWKDGAIENRAEGHPRYCFVAGMNHLPRLLSVGLRFSVGDGVASLTRTESGFLALTESGKQYGARQVVLNLPAPQLLALAGESLLPEAAERLARVTMEPRWALLVSLERDILTGWPALELEGHESLVWLARDHTKREKGARPALVAHADVAWSQARLEDAPASIIPPLIEACEQVVRRRLSIRQVQAHRWRYAKTPAPLGEPFFTGGEGIWGCGDWCIGGRVEGALESGWALAKHLLS